MNILLIVSGAKTPLKSNNNSKIENNYDKILINVTDYDRL
ncbi:hypothetical protein TEQUI_0360 [Taylorella equigenitalis MCE9]|uniref:Uncharacterized protein n=1 Tax=Taylorella equigenitalis (strain MCE9) TaxID=937774 RepID=A0A654KFW0_TAYEM|nr:hypothetical protein TEQUI_0360 [Taylorella equigenitalis MCE9]